MKLTARICVTGSMSAGKTALTARLVGKPAHLETSTTTIGVDCERVELSISPHVVSVYLWDLAGDPRFQCIVKSYVRTTDVVLICFDVTSMSSLDTAKKIWTDVRYVKAIPVIVGCKMDCSEEGSSVLKDADEWALSNKLPLIKTSSKTDKGINLLRTIIMDNTDHDLDDNKVDTRAKDARSCCMLM